MTTWNPSRCTTSPVVRAAGPTGPTGPAGAAGSRVLLYAYSNGNQILQSSGGSQGFGTDIQFEQLVVAEGIGFDPTTGLITFLEAGWYLVTFVLSAQINGDLFSNFGFASDGTSQDSTWISAQDSGPIGAFEKLTKTFLWNATENQTVAVEPIGGIEVALRPFASICITRA